MVCSKQKLSQDTMVRYADKLDYDMVSLFQELSESYICENKHKLNFVELFSNRHLAEDLKLKLINELSITDTFMKQFNEVDWFYISHNCRRLADAILLKIKDRVDPEWLKRNSQF